MQTLKGILNSLLIVILLMPGTLFLNSENASLPNRAMLEEVVSAAQALSASARNEEAFQIEMKKTLTSLYVAAELQTVLKTDNHDEFIFGFASSDSPYLLSLHRILSPSHEFRSIYDQMISYKSYIDNPSPPPPRFC